MATWAIGKPSCDTRARSLYIVVSIGLTSLCFVDDLCQILGMFSLVGIGCVTKCGPAGTWREIQPQMRGTCAQIFIQKDLKYILTARWRASAWSDKWSKNNLLMIPPVDLIRVKNMLNSTISMSYPDVVIACIEHKVSRYLLEQLCSVGEAR